MSLPIRFVPDVLPVMFRELDLSLFISARDQAGGGTHLVVLVK